MTDPQIIAAVISAQQTSIATINAAKWAFVATILAAIVSGIFIIIAAKYAFLKGLKTQEHNNLLEARREVYLNFISQTQKYAYSIHKFKLMNLQDYSLVMLQEAENLQSALQKCILISEPETRLKAENLSYAISDNFTEVMKLVDKWNGCIDKSQKCKLDIQILSSLIDLGNSSYFLELSFRNELKLQNNSIIENEIVNNKKNFDSKTEESIKNNYL
ncbi:hypothetical protein [Acinetobacter bereziniae]|uniref:hypothetical protein n=1 Tax=Acinetobacter bereziniae TaxID=106648 RepID=UPI00125009A6|nr:hypothetical protein [Acinetobacter bereziniae]